jgi:hypothetical protein
MSISMLCSQCGAPADRCDRCSSALCGRRLCSELHDVSCAAVSALPIGASPLSVAQLSSSRKPRPRPSGRDDEAERTQAEHLVHAITELRQGGRSALLLGDLDTAFKDLSRARDLEPDLDHLGAAAREAVPNDWELETDLTPLARALSARMHTRAADAWRRLLEERPARSIQAEAAEWLARDAFGNGQPRGAVRILHAGNLLGRHVEPEAFLSAYKQAGVEPAQAFTGYLVATRLDVHSARANGLRDPLTDLSWSDQDPRWWLAPNAQAPRRAQREETDHQLEAFYRARDLASNKRDQGWLLLAEGDFLAGPLGVRTLGRNVRAGCAEPAEHDTFLRIRMAYEGAADRLPDAAWPWYRLAELLAWAGFAERAREQLIQAERRPLGGRNADKVQRPMLRALVEAGLGTAANGLATAARPFPAEPFQAPLAWRLRLR